MKALQVNPTTGFLESEGKSGYQFDSDRKTRFLAMVEEHFRTTGSMPDIASAAQAVGVHPRTVENHLRDDQAFAEAWRDIRLKGKWKLESKMYEYALTKSGYMDRITWLRKEFPEEYNPDLRVINNGDYSWVKTLVERLSPGIIATEAVITSTPKPIDAP